MVKWSGLTTDKKMVITSFLFVFLTFASAGVFFEQSTAISSFDGLLPYDSQLPTEYTPLGSESSDEKKLKAIVKGSIYKTGENMTVYGACFSGDGYLLPEAIATFTAWYPNGTIVTGPLASMDKITDDFNGYSPNGTGRHKIHVTMSSVGGTYLTEMRCELDGEWAVAFGEWQNPEWVQDIANTYENVTNIYELLQNVAVNLSQFQSDTNTNFSQVLNEIASGNGDVSDLIVQLREFENQVADIDINRWLLDAKNPFYVLGSGTHNWRAVDMLHPDAVAAVSDDGYFAIWDGETWSEVSVAGVEFRDVSILPSNQVYAWAVGGDGVNPVVSINGATENDINLSGGSPTFANAIKLFQDPNNPSGNFYSYVIGDDGSAYMSTDAGFSYSVIGTLDAGVVGEISQVVENYDSFGQVDGYMTILGQGSSVAMFDGVTWTNYTVSGVVSGVDLLYYDLGYVVVNDTLDTKIYKFNGTDFVLEYTIEDPSIVPTGVQIHSQNDVWVTTRDPSVFYHFDGRSWEYSTLAYSDFASVIISFSLGGGSGSVTGLHDVSMSDSRHGYAVGDDGLILIYQGQTSDQFESLLANLTAQLEGIEVNLTPILDVLDAMNITLESVSNDTIHIIADLHAMNVTIEDIEGVVNTMSTNLNGLIDVVNGNFTIVNDKLDAMNLTLDQHTGILNAINATMIQSFFDLNASNQLGFANINTSLVNMNTTLVNTYNLVGALNVSTQEGFQDLTSLINALNVTIDGRFDVVDQNLSAIYAAILAINFTAEFAALNDSMQAGFNNVITTLNTTINQGFSDASVEINNLLACAGASFSVNESESIGATWTAHGTAPYANRGIAIDTVYPNSLLETVTEPSTSSMTHITVFDENFTVLYASSVAGGPVYSPYVSLPYAGRYYILGTRDGAFDAWTRYKSTAPVSFSGAMYSFAHGFECGSEETTCVSYVDLGSIAWEIDTLRISTDINTGEAYMCEMLREINSSVSLMNASVHSELQDIDNFLFSMNATIDYKLDNVLLNVTYTNQYLTTTLFPLINGTFEGVQNILIQLGIMNDTINYINETTTQTLDIVNESATDIDYLVNQSNRIRAWVTQ